MNCRTAVTHGLLCALLGTLLSACAGRDAQTSTLTEPASANAAAETPDAVAVYRQLQPLLPADVLMIGEQHDAPAHQKLQAAVVQALASNGLLATVALEMADQGTSTAGLPAHATQAQVQTALRWNDDAWPWAVYGPVVMLAVRAGVPAVGANLPRDQMKNAMIKVAFDDHLTVDLWKKQQQIIRDGHCGLLPPSQIVPMTRIQTARDAAMAQTIAAARQPGKTVLLIAGNGHVDRELGVPTHLGRDVNSRSLVLSPVRSSADETEPPSADAVWRTPAPAPKDYCADLRRQLAPGR